MLNRLDPAACAALQARLAETGFAIIRNVLRGGRADRLREALLRREDWRIACYAGEPLLVAASEWADRASELEPKLRDAARSGFGYRFGCLPLSDLHTGGAMEDPPLREAIEALFEGEFADFCAEATGMPAIRKVEAHAARYLPGDFLNLHHDVNSDPEHRDRRYAFVLGLTPDWRPDFGGHTIFWEAPGHPARLFEPSHGSLLIFRVPTAHSVSQVSDFADRERVTIAGWLHG